MLNVLSVVLVMRLLNFGKSSKANQFLNKRLCLGIPISGEQQKQKKVIYLLINFSWKKKKKKKQETLYFFYFFSFFFFSFDFNNPVYYSLQFLLF